MGLAIAFFVFATAAQAGWNTVLVEKIHAVNRQELLDLSARLPEHSFADALEANLTFTRERWSGPSVCRPGDSRLEVVYVDGEIRTASGSSGFASARSASDPCEVAHAPEGRWVLEREHETKYRTKEEIALYLAKNPSLRVSPGEVREASDLIRAYRWEGKTLCPAGDPRLFLEQNAGGMRLVGGESSESSNSKSAEDRDPCAK